MICRFSVGAAVLALDLASAGARAQTAGPIVINIAGPCLLSLDGRPTPCAGVAYMAFPETRRIDFTAVTPQAGWAFSGDMDARDGGQYSLVLDSIVSPGAGRVQAEGQCEMDIAEDGLTVNAIQCRARTATGVMELKASGVAGSDGDDDDDGEDGPDSSKG